MQYWLELWGTEVILGLSLWHACIVWYVGIRALYYPIAALRIYWKVHTGEWHKDTRNYKRETSFGCFMLVPIFPEIWAASILIDVLGDAWDRVTHALSSVERSVVDTLEARSKAREMLLSKADIRQQESGALSEATTGQLSEADVGQVSLPELKFCPVCRIKTKTWRSIRGRANYGTCGRCGWWWWWWDAVIYPTDAPQQSDADDPAKLGLGDRRDS